MKYTCHPVGNPRSPIAWCILGAGRFLKGSFIEALKGQVKMVDPDAEFEASFSIEWGEEAMLRLGIEAYLSTKKPRR